jgi:sterol desaturase/sphingolipid hydroxylase (fatty acid hydroxylase superfamily)
MTITEIYDLTKDGVILALSYFTSPNKRVYIPFLFSSLLISYWVFKQSKLKGTFKNYVLNKKVWLSTSSLVDYSFLIFNGVFKIIAIGPWLIIGVYISFYTKEFLLNIWGYPDYVIGHKWIMIMYTIVLFIIKDLSSYLVHGMFHKIPLLWRFHKVHHSAEVLNPITQYRIHPVELMINNFKGVVVFGIVTGFFDFLSDGTLEIYMILGVNVLGFLFMFFGANLRHSHVKLKYPVWLELWLISPVQHQVHHSDRPEHFDKNFGSVLSFWDRIFGTLIISNDVGQIRYGLGKKEGKRMRSFLQNLIEPFK